MDINLKKLIEKINALEEVKPPEVSGGVKYLCDLFYINQHKYRDVRIGEIDFGRFTKADFAEAESLADNYTAQLHTAESVARIFSLAPPKRSKRKSFF